MAHRRTVRVRVRRRVEVRRKIRVRRQTPPPARQVPRNLARQQGW